MRPDPLAKVKAAEHEDIESRRGWWDDVYRVKPRSLWERLTHGSETAAKFAKNTLLIASALAACAGWVWKGVQYLRVGGVEPAALPRGTNVPSLATDRVDEPKPERGDEGRR